MGGHHGAVIKHNYKKLDVWRRSFDAVKAVYAITERFPASERFGLVTQMRRAAVSIPSNIAEGTAQGSGKGFLRFLRISLGSACELETQLSLSAALGFSKDTATRHLLEELDEIKRMLISLQNRITKS